MGPTTTSGRAGLVMPSCLFHWLRKENIGNPTATSTHQSEARNTAVALFCVCVCAERNKTVNRTITLTLQELLLNILFQFFKLLDLRQCGVARAAHVMLLSLHPKCGFTHLDKSKLR